MNTNLGTFEDKDVEVSNSGIRQDHNGNLYRIGYLKDAKQIHGGEQVQLQCYVNAPELSKEAARDMEKVTVISLAYPAALDLVPEDDKQARRKAATLACGPTYQSLAFFQDTRAS